MDESRRRLQPVDVENSKLEGEENEREEDDDEEEFDEDDDDAEQSELKRSVGTELRVPQSQAVAEPSSLQLPGSDDFDAPSHLLSEVPVESLQPRESPEFKIALAEPENQPLLPGCPSSSELSPKLVSHSISSAASPSLPEQTLSPVRKGDGVYVPKGDKRIAADLESVSHVSIVKTPCTDGYNWRKYGQKQVRSPQGSRSYYKCTYSGCCAKKVECRDHSNCVIETIYRSNHSHVLPQKINCTRKNIQGMLASSVLPVARSDHIVDPVREPDDSEQATALKEMPPTPDAMEENSSDSDEILEVNLKDEHVDEPDLKRRLKKTSSSYPSSLKTGKKPKFIVHAAGDVEISSDGYRWRKYGQKMVKGNLNPRNYYRCTSAGCPVRKHIERAVDNTNAVIITYKGEHDHDMPVPTKRHGPPRAPFVAAATSASMSTLQLKKAEVLQNQTSATQWSVDKDGELTGETLDLGRAKGTESTRTLLSIGFEIKPC